VSHNTWDYKNAFGRPLNDNVESWEVFHFEAKDHAFQTRGVRFWCVDFFVINFSKKTTTQNLDDFIYVVILPNFWQTLAQPTNHLQKWPTHLWTALFILYTPDILSVGLQCLKIKFFVIAFHIFFLQAVFKNWHFVLTDFFTVNPMCYVTPCILWYNIPKKWYIPVSVEYHIKRHGTGTLYYITLCGKQRPLVHDKILFRTKILLTSVKQQIWIRVVGWFWGALWMTDFVNNRLVDDGLNCAVWTCQRSHAAILPRAATNWNL
jgi:hypothetical protein